MFLSVSSYIVACASILALILLQIALESFVVDPFCTSSYSIYLLRKNDGLLILSQDECKRASMEGQNLRLDLSARFQDAIKVQLVFFI